MAEMPDRARQTQDDKRRRVLLLAEEKWSSANVEFMRTLSVRKIADGVGCQPSQVSALFAATTRRPAPDRPP